MTLRALALDQGRARTGAYADVQVVEREVREFVAGEKRELSVPEAKINARESYGEGYIMETACAGLHYFGFLGILLLVTLGIVGLPIRDEAVFQFVGYQRVRSAGGRLPHGALQSVACMREPLINGSLACGSGFASPGSCGFPADSMRLAARLVDQSGHRVQHDHFAREEDWDRLRGRTRPAAWHRVHLLP